MALLYEVAGRDAGLMYAPVLPGAVVGGPPLLPVLERTVGTTVALRGLSPRPSKVDPRVRALLKNLRRLMAAL